MQGKEIEECDESVPMNLFKQFDIVNDVGDHHFVDEKASGGSGVTMKIMKEWKILENNLPESIYIRAYEGRIDLLRACIVGATGTPYHDGLFFFDIKFPANYPSQPPKVHYHSYGLEINPNLYSKGMVCLSLLNTWYGDRNENWNSKESTVLQVLLSIQALILNDKPYYNEPGRGTPEWDQWDKKCCLLYNNQVFVLNCKTMMYILNRPPMHFEELVSLHFRERANAILAACKAYVGGHVRVGGYGLCSSSFEVVSNEFRASMDIIYPKLLESFTKNESSLVHSVEQVKLEKEKATSQPQLVEKRKESCLRHCDEQLEMGKEKTASQLQMMGERKDGFAKNESFFRHSGKQLQMEEKISSQKKKKKKISSQPQLVAKRKTGFAKKVLNTVKKMFGLKKVRKTRK